MPDTMMSRAGTGSATPGRASLAKAYLALHDPQPGPGGSARLGASRGQISFQFNPNELTFTKSARWGSEPARAAASTGPAEFQGAEPSTLVLDMFFDAGDGTDILSTVDKLFACCVPTEQSRGQHKPTPPLVVFHWGRVTGFPAFVTSVSATYPLFSADGTPIRAACAVTLQEIATATPGQNPTSGSRTTHRGHVVIAGETLASVAQREYGDPSRWRDLAAINGIDDPLRIAPGTQIALPGAADLAAAGSSDDNR